MCSVSCYDDHCSARNPGALVWAAMLLWLLPAPALGFEIGATQCIVPGACLNQLFNAAPVHQRITEVALDQVTFRSVTFEPFGGPITEIKDANAYVDAIQSDPKYHFDAC